MAQIKPPKPLPIFFVDRVSNIQSLIVLPNCTIKDDYEIKVLSNEQLKLQPKTLEAYSLLVKDLKLKNTEFHIYKEKQERSFRVVIKNVHHSTDIQELKQAIEERGHSVINVWNLKNRRTKMPLSVSCRTQTKPR